MAKITKTTETERICGTCKIMKALQEFYKDIRAYKERDYTCKECTKKRRASSDRLHPELYLYRHAVKRAKKYGLPFNIQVEDIVIPDVCPILGIKLLKNEGQAKASSPSLDRIIPKKGYTKGNVWVISYKANRLKSDATLEELKAIVSVLEKRGV